ncbi:hypothetical protein OIO90_001164 [Microbotryomycetes sp. JL221]|nr:hypothetical protein OIO90_001164 [Microbotryomycetes sp. JL221]
MSSREIEPVVSSTPLNTTHELINDDDKALDSPFDSGVSKSLDSATVVDGDDKQPARAGIVDAFLGRDTQRLQSTPIVWSQGTGPWWDSIKLRARSILTRRFITPYTMYRYGFRAWLSMLWRDGWKYLLLAAVDVEANFLVIKAYGYTDLLSCMLLNAWATPACMIFSFFLVRARYHWTQILGVLICIAGLALNVVSDWHTDKNYPANNRVLGDILMLIGATGYGLSNALEERFVRERPLYEIVGQIGFWGCMINATQGAGLEHDLFLTVSWSGRNIGLLIAYTCAMLLLYTGAPVLFRLGSSVFYNLSILTSNFYGLCFGLGLYHYSPYFLYFIAYPLVLVGLFVYFVVAKPESTSTAELKVKARGKQAAKEEATGRVVVVGERV